MSQSQQSETILSVTYKRGPLIQRPITLSKKVNYREDFRAELYWVSDGIGFTALDVTILPGTNSFYQIDITNHSGAPAGCQFWVKDREFVLSKTSEENKFNWKLNGIAFPPLSYDFSGTTDTENTCSFEFPSLGLDLDTEEKEKVAAVVACSI